MKIEDAGEVLIVGCGPVGIITALALRQAGVSVTVIEAEKDIPNSPRAMVYVSSTLAVLDELGLLGDVAKVSTKTTALQCMWPDLGLFVSTDLSPLAGKTADYMLNCGQNLVAEIAVRHATALGTTVLFSHSLESLEQDENGVIATVQSPEGEKKLRTKWVIGADGARSAVRRMMDIEFEGTTWNNHFVANNVYCDFESIPGKGYAQSNYVCHPDFGGVVNIIDNDGLWRLTYTERPGLSFETYQDRVSSTIAKLIPEGTPHRFQSTSPYRIHQRCATTLRRGRVLLAGDAAHATNPMGGMGLTTGIWTGVVLADLLAAVIRGEEDAAILDRYSDERRRVFWEVTSPFATETKRMIEETDDAVRVQDYKAACAPIGDLREWQLMNSCFGVAGDPIREKSRWKPVNPF